MERLWRSLKHEDIYLKGYADGRVARGGIASVGSPSTILHHNTHLSMWLKKRDFADRGAIPWGILDFGARVL